MENRLKQRFKFFLFSTTLLRQLVNELKDFIPFFYIQICTFIASALTYTQSINSLKYKDLVTSTNNNEQEQPNLIKEAEVCS